MARSGFDYKEYKKWVNNLGISTKNFQTFLKTFLLQQAQQAVRQAKQLTPVDTGALRNSWAIGTQKIELIETGGTSASGKPSVTIDPEKSDIDSIKVVNNYLEVTISNGMEYASYVEYGHHNYQGKFMLKISIDNVRLALPTRFQREFEQFLKNGGVI